jgi:bacterioferritin-associated ferredoxin
MNISDDQIHNAIDWMRAADPGTIISPGKIYHALGKSADCGGCMPLFLETMRSNENLGVPANLRNLRSPGPAELQDEETPQNRPITWQRG